MSRSWAFKLFRESVSVTKKRSVARYKTRSFFVGFGLVRNFESLSHPARTRGGVSLW
jgi:hypothetical protein